MHCLITENNIIIKNCRLNLNDNFLAGSLLSNPNTKVFIGVNWIKIKFNI